MAPEIIEAKGYNESCDIWSIGVTLYEIFYSQLPFGDDLRDPIDVYNSILKKKLVFVNSENDSNVKYVLKKLLNRSIPERMKFIKSTKRDFLSKVKWEEIQNLSNDSHILNVECLQNTKLTSQDRSIKFNPEKLIKDNQFENSFESLEIDNIDDYDW